MKHENLVPDKLIKGSNFHLKKVTKLTFLALALRQSKSRALFVFSQSIRLFPFHRHNVRAMLHKGTEQQMLRAIEAFSHDITVLLWNGGQRTTRVG